MKNTEKTEKGELQLSPGEWKLMEPLWEHSPQTITQLTARLEPQTGWGKHTVITMLNRLTAKGAVRYTEGERARLYESCISRAQAAMRETESLLQRVYGGDLGLLVHAFVQQKGISEAERAQLLAILQQAEAEQPARPEQEG